MGLKAYTACNECGFLFTVNEFKSNTQSSILQHYQKEDPHRAVAYSKKNFFDLTFEYLSSKINEKEKIILDVGCGHGYFIEYTSKKGWKSLGVEVLQDAVKAAREKIGKENIFEGKLKEVNFYDNSFNAITLWDVLAIVDDPYDELKECFRIMKNGATIGIRTRNVFFQKLLYRLYTPFKKFLSYLSFQEPFVFNRFCFSSKAIHILLLRLGFTNIQIFNSPMTSGDPYSHSGIHFPIKIIKALIKLISNIVFYISRGRWIIGPSLLIWAEKP
jgi:2-polyprenyl-3-methyl-5-hydroxy-6-metoxy-1,4-benzoquinol methylase